jgi:hypothetical protein
MFGKIDVMECEILADGTIKTATDSVSPANHRSADEFLEMITKLTGGAVANIRKPGHEGHLHQHGGVWHKH